MDGGSPQAKQWLWTAAWGGLVAGLFLADVLTPRGYSVPILYIVPLLLPRFVWTGPNSYAVAAGLVTLTWLGFAYCLPGDTAGALFNRTLVSVLLFAVAVGIEQHRQYLAQTTLVQASLRESRQQLQAIVEGTSDAVFIKDVEGRYLLCNAAAGRFVGRNPDDIVGHDDQFVFPHVDAKALMEKDRSVMAGGKAVTSEDSLTTADGECRTFLSTKGPIFDAEGRVSGLFGIARDITERKRAEIALKENELRLTQSQEIAHLGSWSWDIRTNVNTWSDENYRIFGYAPKSVEPTYDLFAGALHPDDRDRVLAAAAATVERDDPYDLDCRIVRPDGEIRYVHCKGTVTRDVQGRPRTMAGTVLDITERRRTEQALRLTQFTMDRAANEIFWVNAAAEILYINDAACESLGYSREELIGKTVHDIDPNFPREAWPAHWEELKRRGFFTFESCQRTKDGKTRYTEVTVNHLEYEGQEYNCAIVRDITERKRAEQALRESERRFQLVSQATQDTIWDWDLTTGRVWWSQGIETHWGYAKDQVGATADWWADRIHPQDRERIMASVREALNGLGTAWSGEYRYRRADGSHAFVLDRGHIVRDADGRAVRMIGVEIDITNAKSGEEARRRQAVMERLQEERELIAHNLHDGVLQSLYAVRLGLEHGTRLLKTQPEQAGKHLERQIEDVGQVIAEMRRFLESQDPFWVRAQDLGSGLEELIKLYRSISDIEWKFRRSEDAASVELSREETRQLLYVAREAMSNVARHASATRCRVALDAVGDGLRFAIEDDGVGFRRNEARKGRGLGNMEARARQIGAAIHVAATPGAGTRITIDLIRREAHVAM